MRLTQWELTVTSMEDRDDIADEVTATVACAPLHYEGDICLSEKFLEMTPSKQRYVIAHELCHLHWWWHMRFSENLADQLGAQTRELANDRLREMMELANDETAKMVAPFLPLPPSPEQEAA
jgi:hypothetical protein